MRESARKRKSDDINDDSPGEYTSTPDFVRRDFIVKPTTPSNSRDAFFDKSTPRRPTTPLNSHDAFFDKNNSRIRSLLTESPSSPAARSVDKECVIKSSKSFFDDFGFEDREGSSRYTPRRSPTNFRRELQTKSLSNITHGATPCGVVDELFTGVFGCMPAWECALPWREDEADETDESDESDDEGNKRYGIVRRDSTRHDAEVIQKLSFPKHLGKEFVSQTEASLPERKNRTLSRTIRRSPSSRLTTIESDSRQKTSGSKMIRRTELNTVTEIHWDEEVVDLTTLEKMAKLSVL